MYRVQLARVRRLWLLLALPVVLYVIFITDIQSVRNPLRHTPKPPTLANIPSQALYQFLNLNEDECKATFPDLTKDLDATLAQGPFTLKQAHGKGPLQARVKDNQLYILHLEDEATLSPELRQTLHAALHQINRALLTSPSPLPDTIFSLNIRDQPYGTAWSYARPAYAARASALPPLTRAFLMPHFSFWNWPLPFIGSIARAEKAIARIEADLPFSRKYPRVVWRGSTRFESVYRPTLRRDLLRVTKGMVWADVRALESYDMVTESFQSSTKGSGKGEDGSEKGNLAGGRDFEQESSSSRKRGGKGDRGDEAEDGGGSATTALRIEDFCRYKYVLYTDGVTYSGRLPFLQMCNSVLIAPPPAWRQLSTHLLRPVFSRDLLLSTSTTQTSLKLIEDMNGLVLERKSEGASEKVNKAWPERYSPEDANVVFVAPDWSDLEDTVSWLEDNLDIAAGIAGRQRDLFVGKGYASPAMETCYWRALLRGWSQVVRLEGEGWENQEGVSWEEFSVL